MEGRNTARTAGLALRDAAAGAAVAVLALLLFVGIASMENPDAGWAIFMAPAAVVAGAVLGVAVGAVRRMLRR